MIFLFTWMVAFIAGIVLVPAVNIIELMTLSFLNGIVVFFFIWGIVGIGRRGMGKKAFAILLLMLLMGLAYQNQAAVSSINQNTIKEVYDAEITALASYNATTPETTASITITPTTIQQSSSSQDGNVISGIGNAINGLFNSYPNFNPANPTFINGQANITFPANYDTLSNYALSIINKDRATFGVAPLTLWSVPSGQQHANSMLYFNYFEHTDNQGYDPFTRMEMLGGSSIGQMGENIGQDWCTNSPPDASSVYTASCNIQTIESGAANSEWQMMYNDAVCCGNGHRENILDSSFTEVSIGISYSNSNSMLYFVEDFYGP